MHHVVVGQDEPNSTPFFGPGLRVTPVWKVHPEPAPDSACAPPVLPFESLPTAVHVVVEAQPMPRSSSWTMPDGKFSECAAHAAADAPEADTAKIAATSAVASRPLPHARRPRFFTASNMV